MRSVKLYNFLCFIEVISLYLWLTFGWGWGMMGVEVNC